MKLKLTFIFFIYCIAILLYAQDTNTVENINETEDMDISARNQDNESVRVANDTTSHTGAVSTGYGTVKKEDLTVSVEHIDLENTESMAIANVERMLQGKACGVFAASGSGAPNAPVSVRIHGIGTPNNAEPLYIIDGMPVDEIHFWTNENPQGLSFLSPGDIESIQVLKDASACAMYGIRGANGVVIINTKKGNKGKPVIHFNGYFGNQRMPQNQRHELLNGQEFATLYNEATGVDIFDPATISSLPTTDWQGEIFRVAPIHNALLSLSGGSGMGNYYMSFNKFLQKGIIKHSGYNRYTFRINPKNSPQNDKDRYKTLLINLLAFCNPFVC